MKEWQRAMELYRDWIGQSRGRSAAEAGLSRQHPACTGERAVWVLSRRETAYLRRPALTRILQSPITASASSPLLRRRRTLVVRRCCTWRERINSAHPCSGTDSPSAGHRDPWNAPRYAEQDHAFARVGGATLTRRPPTWPICERWNALSCHLGGPATNATRKLSESLG